LVTPVLIGHPDFCAARHGRSAARSLLEVDAIMEAPLRVFDSASSVRAVETARSEASRLQFASEIAESIAVVTSELCGHLLEQRGGELFVRAVDREGIIGIEIEAAEDGGHIEHAARLFERLATCRRLADELDLDVRINESTAARARKFRAPIPFRSEFGIVGRMCQGERVSGDDALVLRTEDSILVGVADGLGHGSEAREASAEAVRIMDTARAVGAVSSVMREIEAGIVGTRGAVMAIARIHPGSESMEHAGVGDIGTHIYRPRESQRFPSVPGTLGSHFIPRARIRPETAPFHRGELLVMFTDGLTSRTDITHDLELQREHPFLIAESLLARFGRTSDDALVLVLR
jgi:hypothetical protein